MGDLINFPNWVFEKERELNKIENDLAIQKYVIERERYSVDYDKSTIRAKILISFSVGLIVGCLVSILMIVL